jgi:prepilin-type processing-associated H-X9-DG protein
MAIGIPLVLICASTVGLLLIAPDLIKREPAQNTTVCLNNLSQLADAALLYAEDNNGGLPSGSWSSALQPMLPERDSELILACPVQRRIDPETYGYALNVEVAGKKKSTIALPQNTALFFDSSNLKRDAIDSLKSRPYPGRHNHNASNNMAYLDGHTRTIPASKG